MNQRAFQGLRRRAVLLTLSAGLLLVPAAAFPEKSVTSLLDVRPDGRSGAFLLICDGAFQFSRRVDSEPPRVVLELPNVRNAIKEAKLPVDSEVVSGISISAATGGVQGTQVVFDLKRPCPSTVRGEGATLVVRFDTAAAAVPGAAGAAAGAGSAPLPPKTDAPSRPDAGVAGTASPARLGVMLPTERSDYVIGGEDLLEINVFEQPDLNRTVRVSGDGTISVPLLGVIPVSGLTVKETEARLRDLLSAKYLTDPQVTVFVKEAKSKKVSVVGAVEKPGTVEMLGQRSLLEAISEAGGLTQQAGKDLYVLRSDRSGATTRIDVDLDDLMIKGNPELNIPILPGDVINIPIDRILHVYVDGAVRKPGEVEYKNSRPLNLLQAIAAAGGLSERASQKGIVLIRNRPDGAQEMYKVDLKAVRKGKQANMVLVNGDSIYVPETFF
ncbi:MAG TPA: polysaccharide biosynthesis/export family protein [Candidatus Polarisedimenticolia bacterium]|nr:polysaccharide biosynthesis/export family protein [Candidatus Polarisedimenticolia bacterium]